jgi:hypothetical protein
MQRMREFALRVSDCNSFHERSPFFPSTPPLPPFCILFFSAMLLTVFEGTGLLAFAFFVTGLFAIKGVW